MKKKGAVYSVIALMLCVAVYLNWSYNKEDAAIVNGEQNGKVLGQADLVDGTTGGDTTKVNGDAAAKPGDSDATTATSGANTGGDGYFAEARLSRQRARDEAVSIFNATVENQNATQGAKDEAASSIKSMAECAVKEARIENLVIAKGYSECVAFINDNGVNVIVSKPEEGIKDSDVAKIKDIVIDETDVKADNIKIIETAQ